MRRQTVDAQWPCLLYLGEMTILDRGRLETATYGCYNSDPLAYDGILVYDHSSFNVCGAVQSTRQMGAYDACRHGIGSPRAVYIRTGSRHDHLVQSTLVLQAREQARPSIR